MPTITLQDGQVVHISQERYDALAEAVKPKELTYKELTYNDVAIGLFKDKKVYYRSLGNSIISRFLKHSEDSGIFDADNAPTENQLKQLFALNKLFNVAYYLNEGWEPEWSDIFQKKVCIMIDNRDIITVERQTLQYMGTPYFRTKDLAQRAIAILGEKSIKECFGIFE